MYVARELATPAENGSRVNSEFASAVISSKRVPALTLTAEDINSIDLKLWHETAALQGVAAARNRAPRTRPTGA